MQFRLPNRLLKPFLTFLILCFFIQKCDKTDNRDNGGGKYGKTGWLIIKQQITSGLAHSESSDVTGERVIASMSRRKKKRFGQMVLNKPHGMF